MHYEELVEFAWLRRRSETTSCQVAGVLQRVILMARGLYANNAESQTRRAKLANSAACALGLSLPRPIKPTELNGGQFVSARWHSRNIR